MARTPLERAGVPRLAFSHQAPELATIAAGPLFSIGLFPAVGQ